MTEEIILCETYKDVLVLLIDDNELKVRPKEHITNEEYCYEPVDNTLDESTLHYILCRNSWYKNYKIQPVN